MLIFMFFKFMFMVWRLIFFWVILSKLISELRKIYFCLCVYGDIMIFYYEKNEKCFEKK